MAEGVLFHIASKLLESLGKSAFRKVASWCGARSELNKLEQSLRLIKARVIDAEKRCEAENSATIKEWLRRLRAVFFKAEDLFDDVLTAEQRKLRMQGNMTVKVSALFPSSSPLLFNIKLARQIKSIRQDLDAIKSDMDGLNLNVCDHRQESRLPIARLMSKRETASFVQEDDVVGRKKDKNAIIEMLFDPMLAEESLSVIPIVGFGGLGKTTLAQLVFNDDRVKQHFELIKWACVPEVDDQKKIMGKVLNSFTGKDPVRHSLEEILTGIRDSINNKKYLLVLDDIWDESRDRWLRIMDLLKCGKTGSKIIVTTRSAVVANVVGTVPAHDLGLLTKEESWKLFKILAYKDGQEEKNPNFIRIGEDIVAKCANLPLAIRVIGSLLYSKDTEQEWLLFRDDHLSKTKITEENILPVLKLSYDFLPSPLKQCFAYCSLFPKDYEFKKTELIHLWMAQGYIEPSEESINLEDVGDIYFLELLRRNFFQDASEDIKKNDVCCKMHDLVHDLSLHAAGDWLAMRTMRSVLNNLEFSESNILSFQFLRALNLKGFYSTKMAERLGRLRHLRYLSLEDRSLECRLSNAITKLENLQTLNLCCPHLKKLPSDFTKLENLRHLEISYYSLNDMPSGFGKMKSLRQLNYFVVGKSNGVDTLADFDLKGELRIVFRKWRRNTMSEVKKVNLKRHQQLTSLILSFFLEEEEVTPTSDDMKVLLEYLMFPPNLKFLKVEGYEGERFPSEMVQNLPYLLPYLGEITIEDCESCRQLPRFSQLPHLKSLSLKSITAVEYIEEEDGWVGDGKRSSATYFPALEKLDVRSMPELKGWWPKLRVEDDVQVQRLPLTFFPRLSEVNIFDCRQLASMPLIFSTLEKLGISNINEKLVESLMTSLGEIQSSSSATPSKIKYLIIGRIENLVSLSINLCNVETLRIYYCANLTSLTAVSPNSTIRVLYLCECNRLRNVCNELRHLSALEELIIDNCEELDMWDNSTNWLGVKSLRYLSITDWKLQVLPEEIGQLSKLRQLNIVWCPNLATLPQSFRSLTSLLLLYILDCPHLNTRCQRPDGEDWPLIQHIPDIRIR